MSQNKSFIQYLRIEDVLDKRRNSFLLLAVDLEECKYVLGGKLALDIPSSEIDVLHLNDLDKPEFLQLQDALSKQGGGEEESNCVF
jgi:hypothetical protein